MEYLEHHKKNEKEPLPEMHNILKPDDESESSHH